VTEPLTLTVPTPLSMLRLVAPDEVQLRVVDEPLPMFAGWAVKVTVGGGGDVTEGVPGDPLPPPPHPLNETLITTRTANRLS